VAKSKFESYLDFCEGVQVDARSLEGDFMKKNWNNFGGVMKKEWIATHLTLLVLRSIQRNERIREKKSHVNPQVPLLPAASNVRRGIKTAKQTFQPMQHWLQAQAVEADSGRLDQFLPKHRAAR
jgi:hypothetical protein